MVSTLLALSACNNHESGRPSEAAKPAPPAANSAETHAKQAVQLFVKNCVATGADGKALAGVAAQGKLLLLNEAQKQEFNFEPQAQQVWGAHTQEGGRFFLVSASKSDSAAHAAVNTMPAANTAPMFLSATATNRKNSTILIIVFISHLSPPAPAATIKTFIMIIHIIFTHILIFFFFYFGAVCMITQLHEFEG